MIELIAIVFMIEPVVLLFVYIADSELKLVSRIGIKQTKLLKLHKWKYLFVFSKRKEGVITKHAFMCMVAYYIINSAGFIALLVQLMIKSDSFITASCVIFGFVNIGLLFLVVTQPRLSFEQRKQRFDYLQKRHEDYKKKKGNNRQVFPPRGGDK